MCNKINILMTGAGAPGGPGILRALQSAEYLKVHCADMNEISSGRFLSEHFHKIPSANDEGFIQFILELCLKNNIKLIFPLVTLELFLFAENKNLFLDNGIEVLVSDFESLSVANDKGKLLHHLKDHGLAYPDFHISKSVEQLTSSVSMLGYPDKPVVIKPCVGNGSRGIRVLHPEKDRYNLLFNEKPNSLYTTFDDVLAAIGDRDIPELVVSEYMPGDELTIDCVVNNSNLELILIRSRDRMSGGISTAGRFIENQEVKNYITSIVKSFKGLNGAIGFQVKRASDGSYLLLESNPRIQGTSVAALGCGVNLPLIVVNNALGIENPELDIKSNVGFIRCFEELYYEC
ncbi:ATP-grasp domain-containing protein [Vibrio splendidus]|uniref:ATP-grasp domain-containing protein n=1 Tax=Vibrio splendidus TaxID=29497 RepID=UPI00352CB83D